MGRKRGYDREQALDRATDLFWRQGYENTSLSELLEAMGILNGSFYNAFGDKKSLYLASLEHYNRKVTARRIEAWLGEKAIGERARAFFGEIHRDLRRRRLPNGCLMSNSLEPEVLEDDELGRYVRAQIRAARAFFTEEFRAARERGELRADLDPELAAGLLLTYLQGLFRISNLRRGLDRLEEQTEFFLESLGL